MCGLHAGRVVSNFIMQALQGKPLTVSCVKEVHWRGRGEEEGGGRSERRGEEEGGGRRERGGGEEGGRRSEGR